MKKEERIYIKRFSKIDNLDQYMAQILFDKHGERFIKYRENWSKSMDMDYESGFPMHLDLETVDACNLSCEICIRAYDKGSKKKFDFELYKSIINEGSMYGLSSVMFGNGGEPTLHPELPEMIEYAAAKGVMDTIIVTNGQVLNSEKTIDLVMAGVTRISFSLDAATEEIYKLVRKSDLDKVENCINAVLDYKKKRNIKLPIIRVSFCNFEKNRSEKEMFIEKWMNKVDYIDIQDYIPPPQSGIEELKDIDVEPFSCPQPWQRLSVNPDGTVYPCCTYYAKFMLLGNLKEHSLKYLWDSGKIKELRNSLKNGNYSIICKNCFGRREKQ